MARLCLIRHAKAAQPAGVPEPNWPLTPEGEAQAEALAPLLAELGITRLYASPFARALATLAPYGAKASLPIGIHDGLRERKLAQEPIADFIPALQKSFAEPHHRLPGGETHDECRHRITSAIGDIMQRHTDERIAVCSHGAAITTFMGTLDPAIGFDFWQNLKNPHVLLIETGDRPVWRNVNF